MKAMKWGGVTLMYAFVILLAAGMTVPFVYMLATSLKTLPESMQYPPTWIPRLWVWDNYVQIWHQTELLLWLKNSFVVAIARVASQLVLGMLAAYAFAFLSFRGKQVVFIGMLMVLMIPHQVVIIPQFLLMKQLGWLDSYKALIVPQMVWPFAIFLFRQYFLTLPLELIEAAKMDGCNPLGTLLRIVIPNAKPVMMTMILVTFLSHWNDFMWPLIVTNSQERMVLPVGMANMVGEFSTNWPVLMTVATYATLPVIALFIGGQRYFIEGMTSSGLK
ncbi:carbohydrate ABC transporter permease [Paenibacillus eucommiae]|uniref:Multiple sugar transport system permease protein n=1 Tax=Paenibacillus eucommiae TaxID=1355755 RepID=A0ABS4ILR2_9BACL|nr:carbohydrate ABC transporter permease [Paenibacillus eucommiae]MBP1988507.1 multiple sugar transport system permease protein [Paenibacillus eucommiae]